MQAHKSTQIHYKYYSKTQIYFVYSKYQQDSQANFARRNHHHRYNYRYNYRCRKFNNDRSYDAPAQTNPDLDGDGTLNANDAFPLDSTEQLDTDNDGVGNNTDTDIDGDGDGDGILNDADTGTNADFVSCSLLRDRDGDGVFDAADADPTNPDVRFNFAPIFTSETPIQATEDQLYSYQIVFTDNDKVNDTIVFYQFTYPTWLTLNESTKQLSSTPTNSAIGNHNVVIRINNGKNADVEQSFTVTVVNTNDAPVITQGQNILITMSEDGAPIAFSAPNIDTTDDDNDTLTWTLIPNATNGTVLVSGTGATPIINYTPSTNYNGNDSFEVQVNDGNSGNDTITANITIEPVDDAPTITGSPSASATANDIKSDSLSFSIQHKPSWITFNTVTGALSGTPIESNIGGDLSNIIISVTANSQTTNLASFTITVSEEPVIGAIWNQSNWDDGSTWQ
ncbi:hypothetical protein CVPH_1368 [Abyssogena phaseoliformis symbiont OG214]|nr:hypothetical protein CVPH_1368 [Abyssogena phaseoliformis symbiont OG214]